MPIQVYAVTSSEAHATILSEYDVLPTLGKDEDEIAVQLQELMDSVTTALSQTVKEECNLTVEISGTVDFKAKGGIKYLFFNVGAETGKASTMKVTLATTLKPTPKGLTSP